LRARYAGNLRLHVVARIGWFRVTDITVDDIARLIAELEREGKAAWGIRGCLVDTSRVLATAERRGLSAAPSMGPSR